MTSPSLNSALIRILVDNKSPRQPAGAGFLVTPNHVLTCAHVIASVLEIPLNASKLPDAEVFLDFPLLNQQPLMNAKVVKWYPVKKNSVFGEIEDIAVLQLSSGIKLPDNAQPAPLVVMDDFFDRSIRMCGFPKGLDKIGDWIDGNLKGLVATGKVQFEAELGKRFVKPGFSGTPVWDKRENAVCGIVVSMIVLDNMPPAYMIPASTLINAFSELDNLSRPKKSLSRTGSIQRKRRTVLFWQK